MLTAAKGAVARERIAERLPAKIVDGFGSSFRSSVYLDVPGHELAKAALADGSRTLKLRVKDYYQIVDGAPRFDERCWLEVKLRSGPMVEKSRFEAPRGKLASILETGPPITPDPVRRAAQEAFEGVRGGRPLAPLVVAHYRRWTYQDDDSRFRVTFDDGLSFHLPPRDAFGESVPICARQYLPPPLIAEPAWIVEVKSLGLAPEWIEEALGGVEPVDYSKFMTGVRALVDSGVLEAEGQGG